MDAILVIVNGHLYVFENGKDVAFIEPTRVDNLAKLVLAEKVSSMCSIQLPVKVTQLDADWLVLDSEYSSLLY